MISQNSKQMQTNISVEGSIGEFLREATISDVALPYFNLTAQGAGDAAGNVAAGAVVGAFAGAAVGLAMNAGGPCGPENVDMLVADNAIS